MSGKRYGNGATFVKILCSCLAAGSLCAAAVFVASNTSPEETSIASARSIDKKETTMVASVSPAQRSLMALGITSAEVQKAEEPRDDYYVMFTSIGNDEQLASGEPSVLAHIRQDGNVSLELLRRDVAHQLSPEFSVVCNNGTRVQVREAIQRESGIQVAYYAVVDDAYLSELEANLEDMKAAGEEWAAKMEAEERVNLKTTIDDTLWYNQRDYEGHTYQHNYDIPTYGCGLCASAVALDMLFAKDWDPLYVADKMKAYGDATGIQYCVAEGTSYGQWRQVMQDLFEVNIRLANSQEDVKQALLDGKMVIAGNGGNVYLDPSGRKHVHPGHIICFYKTDGESLWAKDSAECGGPSIRYSAEDFDSWWQAGSDRMFIMERRS